MARRSTRSAAPLYEERSAERVNRRNGYRERDWDSRVGSIELAIPKLRAGSYFPEWLLQTRRHAEQVFVSVIADACLVGVSTRRVEKLCASSASSGCRKSQVSRGHEGTEEVSARDRRVRPGPEEFLLRRSLRGTSRGRRRAATNSTIQAARPTAGTA